MNGLSKFSPNPLTQVPLKKTVRTLLLLSKPAPADGGNEIWFLTLSDLLMLLMIFFVLYLGITLKEQMKTPVAASAPLVEKALPVPPAVEEPAATATAVRETASLESGLLSIIDDNQSVAGITVERRRQNVVLTFPEQIIFDSGQAELKSSARPLLSQVALFIQKHPNLSVEIQGHTDNRPISSKRYPSNWELSADRATQVAKALIQLGINPANISTKGFGEYRPLHSNENDAGRLKNRRVELQFSFITP
jgi:chemotaxis protein MotB